MVVTGGPGVGKTTLVRGLLQLLDAQTARAELAAPTGRAAKRLSEATGRPAATIHRLLEFDALAAASPRTGDPLDADLIVVDEASMLDTVLAYHLLRPSPTAAG